MSSRSDGAPDLRMIKLSAVIYEQRYYGVLKAVFSDLSAFLLYEFNHFFCAGLQGWTCCTSEHAAATCAHMPQSLTQSYRYNTHTHTSKIHTHTHTHTELLSDTFTKNPYSGTCFYYFSVPLISRKTEMIQCSPSRPQSIWLV